MLKSFAGGSLFGEGWSGGEAGVLALHGWRRSHDDFLPVVHAMAALTGEPPGLVAIDLPGFGATPAPPGPWGSDEYARALVRLFEEPGLLSRQVLLVGHSFGGRVALHLATMVPERIDRLVLTGVPLLDREGRRARPALGYRLARTAHRIGLVGDARMEAYRQKYGSPDYRAAQGVMRAVFVGLLAERYGEQMAGVRVPVELVWGEDDTEVPVEVALRARPRFSAAPSATLVALAGVGHLTPTEAPRALAQVVLGLEPAPPWA